MRIKSFQLIRNTVAALVVAMVCGEALAGYTTVAPPPSFELGHDQILSQIYGGTFTASGNNFTNGAITAIRIEDLSASSNPMDTFSGTFGSASDQVWLGTDLTIVPLAKFSLYTQTLGYTADDGTGFVNLFDVTGYGFDINNTSAQVNLTGQTFVWARTGDSGTHSSKDDLNSDFRDHMVTYLIEGLDRPGVVTWVMLWEDLNLTPDLHWRRSYADFNDLVIEVRAQAGHLIPLPPAFFSGLAMLIGSVIVQKIRKVRRRR